MRIDGNKGPSHLSVVFWDGFDAMNAIAALARSGFSAQEVSALGVLTGSAPELEPELLQLGLSKSESAGLKQLFDEGAVVLVVWAQQSDRRKIAARLMEKCGGIAAANAGLS